MAVTNALGWTFDTVASTYEKMRPGYPEELYRTLFRYCPMGPESRAVEVGTGGGQATGPVLATGCSLIAVEPGEKFSGLLREKFKAYDNFSVLTGKFEEVDLPENSFDLVFSATAFHWVPERIGYEKVFSLLKPGGTFARFANHPDRDKGNPALSDEIDQLYAEYYYPFHNRTPEKLREYGEQQAAELAGLAGKYGFTDICHALFYRTRSFTAPEYTALLGTYSDHIALEESVRTAFFREIERAIHRHGGTLTVYDTIDLQLARKP